MSLLSTADVRLWMSLPDGDIAPNAKIDALIPAIEDFVDSFCNRKFEAARYNSDPQFTYLDGTGLSYIYAPQYPVSYVFEVNVDGDREFSSGTLIATADIFWYPSGKIVSEAGYFTKGRRNVKLDFIGGYAPVVGGTHNSAVSTYPLPNDLKQVMLEMVSESFKEGLTMIHTIQSQEGDTKFIQMLSANSFWRNTLVKYKAFDIAFDGNDD